MGFVDYPAGIGGGVLREGITRMKSTVFSAVVVAIATSAASAQQAVQWRVEDGGNGHWYGLVIAPAGITWSTASTRASAAGAHLVACEQIQERAFVFSLFTPQRFPQAWFEQVGNSAPGESPLFGPWIGGYQTPGSAEPYGGWQWVTGSLLDPSGPSCCNDWCSGTPEDRLHLYTGSDPTAVVWNDLSDDGSPCGGSPTGYILEWSADCNSDGIVDYGQILSGQLADSNQDGVPDTCQCSGDITGNGSVNGLDLAAVLSAWGTNGQGEFWTDLNADGIVDGQDLTFILANWGPCP
jgi:hypothetical protein